MNQTRCFVLKGFYSEAELTQQKDVIIELFTKTAFRMCKQGVPNINLREMLL